MTIAKQTVSVALAAVFGLAATTASAQDLTVALGASVTS